MDRQLEVVLLCIFVLFALEWVANCLFRPHFKWGFFFWMDLVGTLSIVLNPVKRCTRSALPCASSRRNAAAAASKPPAIAAAAILSGASCHNPRTSNTCKGGCCCCAVFPLRADTQT